MNTQNLTVEEQESQAYAAGDTATAALLARIIELEYLEKRVEELEDQLKDVQGTLDNQTDFESYKDFFEGCFERLAGHYPCPSITSDYDKSVIFTAIEKSEGGEV
jgi:pyridoxal/pyridoxine/pyridoxamine kinase